ncbi:MAG TPA: response regulator transcription factor [Cryomorphaceae bacterium]|nr:response regulator transcription factor [Cryomorphaceae bacterium]
MKNLIRLMIADDHQVLLDGLVMMLDNSDKIKVVTSASNGREVLAKLPEHEVDVLLMDIQMPELDGYETAKIVSEKHPNVKVITLSMHSERIYIERMYEAGVAGYLLKSAGKEEIVKAIEKVYNGETYFSSEVAVAMLSKPSSKKTSITASSLTRREKEIMELIASGMTNPEIAEKLFLSTDTIKTHRKNMMRKLNVNNTAALVKFALENGE